MIRFISFEGGDGSGKSTQLELLAGYLSKQGIVCLSTREPGGTNLGKMLRKVLLELRDEPISPETELFLYLADRAQHVQKVIEPAMAGGKLVLCDRFTDSTLAYQGYGRGVDLDVLGRMNAIASRGLVPDLTFLLDCPVEVGLSRTQRRSSSHASRTAANAQAEDRFERESALFHQQVRRGFLALAQADLARMVVIDAARSIASIHQEIVTIVEQKLKGR